MSHGVNLDALDARPWRRRGAPRRAPCRRNREHPAAAGHRAGEGAPRRG